MLLSYSDTDQTFYLSAMRDEVFVPIQLGMRRNKAGLYTTGNWSIAKRFQFYADAYATRLLKAWTPRSNRALTTEIAPPPAGLRYMPHQVKGIRFCLGRQRVMLADQQGTGKTPTACGVIRSVFVNANYKRALIVSPAAMRVTWQREAERWTEMEAPIINAKVGKERVSVNPRRNGIYVINYDILKRYQAELVQWLRATESILVLDEAHFAKNPDAQRAKASQDLIDAADRCLMLTGTPFPNSHKESFYLFNAISAEHFDSWSHHEENLACYADQFMLRRTREEVFPHMPRKVRQFVLLSSEGLQRNVQAEIAAYKRESGRDLLTFDDFSRARRELAMKKLPMLKHIAETRYKAVKRDGEKLVVFAYHRDMVECLTAHLRACGAHAVSYYGDQTPSQKEAAFQAFQHGNADVMVASIRSAGVGLTITAANHVLFAELDFVPAMLEQAEDRTFRHGQTKQVTVTYVLVEGSFDEYVLDTLLRKQDETNTIIRQTTL